MRSKGGGEGGGGVVCKISADDIETEVMSYTSSMNWNVTIAAGVISHSLPGFMFTFTLTFQFFKRATRGRPMRFYCYLFFFKMCIFFPPLEHPISLYTSLFKSQN